MVLLIVRKQGLKTSILLKQTFLKSLTPAIYINFADGATHVCDKSVDMNASCGCDFGFGL